MSDVVDFPTYLHLVGFGTLIGGICGLFPTPAGAPAAVTLGLSCLCVARWIR
jgi:hypothetical protein